MEGSIRRAVGVILESAHHEESAKGEDVVLDDVGLPGERRDIGVLHWRAGRAIDQIVLHVHEAGSPIHVDAVAAVAGPAVAGVVPRGCVVHVVDLVVENLVAARSEVRIADVDVDSSFIVADSLEQIVDVVERDHIVRGPASWRHIIRPRPTTDGNTAVVAVVNVVVGVGVVMPVALGDAECGGNKASVAFHYVILHKL